MYNEEYPDGIICYIRQRIMGIMQEITTISNLYLENETPKNSNERIMLGQNYEDLLVANHSLQRFVEGKLDG